MKYVCPLCKTPLTTALASIFCPSCGKQWENRDDIPMFTSNDFYWGEVPRQDMQHLLDLLEKDCWDDGLAFLEEKHHGRNKFVFEASRADWHYYFPLSKESVVLDIGTGWGSLAFPLTKLCKEVVAFDATYERAKFVTLRKRREGIENLQVFVGNLLELPLPPKSFDLIILNGVLEWIGTWRNEGSPRDVQLEALRKIKSLLRPGGYLYIGIENRMAYGYLLGGHDHSGLRLTSWMPRWLANCYCHMRLKKGYRTYTYTRKGYEKLLHEAGFEGLQFYMPINSYNDPRFIVPYDNLNVIRYTVTNLLQRNNWRRILLVKLVKLNFLIRLYRRFTFCYCIRAEIPRD